MGVSIIARDTHRSHSTHDKERKSGRRDCKRRKRKGEGGRDRQGERETNRQTDRIEKMRGV